MNDKILLITVCVVAISIGSILGINQLNKNKILAPHTNVETETITPEDINEPVVEPPVLPKEVKAKAIYLTGWSVGTKNIRENTIANLIEHDFNAVVIDIKDEAGHLSYNSSVQTAIDIKASRNMIKDIKSVIQEFKDNNIYVIGRIVTFKDPTYANAKTDIAYKNLDGNLWKDYSGNCWPNPYNEASWDYPLALAKEAATLGFDEIQFDYIRFPSSEGRVRQISFGFDADTKTKSDVIVGFLTKAMEELNPSNVFVSADVFGITTKRDGDFENIGQDFAKIASIVDIICPMVYPSHYASGEYKITYPDTKPYETVYAALKDAKTRVQNMEKENTAIIRPYLQDFSASWLRKRKIYII